jgi:formylmethanofuran dehydrogenase subunit E
MKDFVDTLNEEQRKALLEALSSKDSVSSQAVPKKVNQETKKHLKSDFIVNTKTESSISNNKRREPVRGRENRWEDTGEFRDIETPEVERSPRRRAPPRKIDVECASCGKSFKVDSRFVYGEYYRCNRCGSKK